MHQYPKSLIETREAFLKIAIQQQKEIIKIYKSASEDIEKKLISAKKGTLNERYLKELSKSIDKYRKELHKELNKKILEDIKYSANVGTEQGRKFFEDIDVEFKLKQSFIGMFTNISDDVVKLMVSGGFYKDKTTLSSRIWSLTEKNVRDIDKLINIAIAEQSSVNELSEKLVPYLRGEGTKQKTLLKGINRNIAYEAVRLGRTSMAHAINEATIQSAMNNPFAHGIKWNLSSSHVERMSRFGKTRDICDEYAEQNRYNLGTGVFPPERTPVSHPNCLCHLIEVQVDVDEASKEIIKWINGASNPKLDKWARYNGFDV